MSQDLLNQPLKTGKRMASGIPGMDVIFEGGLVPNRSYLLVGPAGSGKTIFSLQWLLHGAENRETCLYITLAEPSEEIQSNVKNFGWNLAKINMLDLSPGKKPMETSSQEYHMFSPNEVEVVTVWEEIYKAVAKLKPKRLVIDSATQLRYLATDEYQFRKHILNLITYLNINKVTSFLLFEPSELTREISVGLAVDGIIRLAKNTSQESHVNLRTLQVEKFRGSSFLSGGHPLRFEKNGIRIFPHIIEHIGSPTPGKYMLRSGVKKLDQLLEGGLDSGTTTIISGPSGVGKSTLSMQFMIEACRAGKKSILFAFEESANSIALRCKGIGTPIDDLLENGSLKIVRMNPMETCPDQFIETVREEILNRKFEVVVIDSLRGYQLSMQEYGTLVTHVHNLVTFLNRNNINTILINEVEAITGNLSITELGVSHLADNVILIRYAEYASRVIKVIACLKKRLSNFEPELREIRVTKQGIDISEKLESLQGILSGIPTVNH